MSPDGAGSAERVETLLDLGRPEQALALASRLVAAAPQDADALLLLARTHLHLRRLPEAEAGARAALAQDPDDPVVLSVLAAALAGQRRHDEALDAVHAAVRLAPLTPELHVQQATIELAAGRPGPSLAAARTARGLAPSDVGAALAVARALIELRDETGARAAAADALRLDPDSADAHHVAGLTGLHFGGDRGEAVARFREALRLDPQDRAARAGLVLAVKTGNPLFRAFFAFALWFESQSSGRQWAVRLAPFVIARLVAPFRPAGWTNVVVGVVVAALVLLWTTEPVTNLVLLASPRHRTLVEAAARRASALFAVFALAAAAAVLVGTGTGVTVFVPTGFGLAVWCLALGLSHTVSVRARRLLERGAAFVGTVLAGIVVLAALGRTGGPHDASGIAIALEVAVAGSGVAALVVALRSRGPDV